VWEHPVTLSVFTRRGRVRGGSESTRLESRTRSDSARAKWAIRKLRLDVTAFRSIFSESWMEVTWQGSKIEVWNTLVFTEAREFPAIRRNLLHERYGFEAQTIQLSWGCSREENSVRRSLSPVRGRPGCDRSGRRHVRTTRARTRQRGCSSTDTTDGPSTVLCRSIRPTTAHFGTPKNIAPSPGASIGRHASRHFDSTPVILTEPINTKVHAKHASPPDYSDFPLPIEECQPWS
jgi:hypothetical protein